MRPILALCFLCLATSLQAAEQFPAPDWKDAPNPLASPYAEPGGEISVFVSQFPKSLNYYLEQNVFCANLFGSMYDGLLQIGRAHV